MIRRFHIGLSILAAVIGICVIAAGISAIVCYSSLAVHEYDIKIDGVEYPFTAVLLTDLHDKRYGDDERRLYFGIRLENDFGAWSTRKELSMATLYELEEEREEQPEGMCHRQHTNMAVTSLQIHVLTCKDKIRHQATIGYHHTF